MQKAFLVTNKCIFLFCFSFQMGSHYIVQTVVELLGSKDPPASASQVVGTTGAHYCAYPKCIC
jgi:hypothetical protein